MVSGVAAVLLVGCGTPTTYSNYYNPAWMADGRIIAVRDDVTSYTNGFAFSAGGSSEHKYYLVVMNADGSGEHIVKDVGENIPIINVSPHGNYIAHDDGSDIAILDANYNRVASIPWRTKGSVWYLFDWSPDESKLLVYVDSTTHIFDRSGSFLRTLESVRSPRFWKYGSGILGQTSEHIALFDDEGNVVIESELAQGGTEYFVGGEYYFGGHIQSELGLRKIKVSDFSVTETYPTLNEILRSIEYEHIQINPVTQTELMYSEPNSRLGGSQEYQAIWLIDLDGSNQRRLRK